MTQEGAEIAEGATLSLADFVDGAIEVSVSGTGEGIKSATVEGDVLVNSAKSCSVTIKFTVEEGYAEVEPKTVTFTVTA